LEDEMEDWKDLIPGTVSRKYEVHNFNHALEILSQAYKQEFDEIIDALEKFSLSKVDIMSGGGNESAIPKKLSALLHPKNWSEVKITGDLVVHLCSRNKSEPAAQKVIENFIDGHTIDYVKEKIAIDME
jgi:predicted negative regulator of RcsB-dependent stress response